MSKKFSIIIPCLNTPKNFIDKCISSAINQFPNTEIILVDNGSDKNFFSYLLTFQNLPQVKIIRENKLGVSSARNKGLSYATGDYIIFLDSDDYLEKNCLEKLSLILEKNPADIVIHKTNIHELDGSVNENKCLFNDGYIKDKNEIFKSIFCTTNTIFSCIETPWAKCYSKKFLDKNNINFSEDLLIGEDVLFNIKCYTLAENIYVSNLILHNYQRNPNSLSSSFQPNMSIQSDKLIRHIAEFNPNLTDYEYFNYYCIRILSRLLRKYYNHLSKEDFKSDYSLLLNNPYIVKALLSNPKDLNASEQKILELTNSLELDKLYELVKSNKKKKNISKTNQVVCEK